MADWYGFCRSNYFRVRDLERFKEFCKKWNLTFIEKVGEPKGLVGFLIEEGDGFGGMPSGYHDEKLDDYVEADPIDELALHLRAGEVAIVMECGAEKLRYVSGWAVAINSKGERETVDLQDIYKRAEKLGKHMTRCEY
jgi:hypothetical protein